MILDDPWAKLASCSMLRDAAADHFGACDDGSLNPEDADWVYEILPTSILPIPPGGWEQWWIEVVEYCNSYPIVKHRLTFVDHPITESIIVSIDGDNIQIWDGWHRAGAAIKAGREYITAIVGRPKSLA